MPIKKCIKKGKSGHQWGNQKCYTGKGSKSKAIRQGKAIKVSKWKKK